MCGRFSLATTKEKLQQQLPFVEIEAEPEASYNIAPTQQALVVTNEKPFHWQYLSWGLVPYWSNDAGKQSHLINARREGIESKPSFRIPLRQHRCLVPADSFYEWRREGDRKIPYRILLDSGGLLLFAGIWDAWSSAGAVLKSFSIITSDANADVAALHNRMPVFLSRPEDQRRWLETGDLDELLQLIAQPAEGQLSMYRVSEELNSPFQNFPGLHAPVPEPPALF